jgi:DNA-binding transcriptional regulator YiaG
MSVVQKKANPWPRRLKALRKKLGSGDKPLSQAAAADRARVALRTWISWENDQRRPSGPALQLLKIAFPGEF